MQHEMSLCKSCRHVKEVVSGTGSRFWLCQLAATDPRLPKYPPQPVMQCGLFAQQDHTRR